MNTLVLKSVMHRIPFSYSQLIQIKYTLERKYNSTQKQKQMIIEPLLWWFSQNKLEYEKLGCGLGKDNGKKDEKVQRTNWQ